MKFDSIERDLIVSCLEVELEGSLDIALSGDTLEERREGLQQVHYVITLIQRFEPTYVSNWDNSIRELDEKLK